MTEDELIQKVHVLAANPRRATSAAGWSGSRSGSRSIHAPSFSPAPGSVIEDAKRRFGFPVPNLLLRLWSEVANGGIGPGYGIYGVEGGMTDETFGLPHPDLFLEWRDSEAWTYLIGEPSAKRTFEICNWGCNTFSAIDCGTPEGNMLLLVEGMDCIDQSVSFASWIEDWVKGIEVGSKDYGRVKKRARWHRG